ncbi:uncharacterized protein H6S33_009697 [Morchella sextelata]|uniref:uncharacterized protein n=1 Tax=Morchella sextelata TaxID=1174677 RepID=UPI001D04BDA0|nr:uncharacterized protein H6S33_009697 [Morchella sextelata]KAH0613317.1 hypothetical protein H6S33_009697 [Morchella sextelata]
MDPRLPLPTLTLPPIPDPTDWDATLLPLLHPLDAALRCQICKDFFTAPVLTNCQHTFCSECIRRALHADSACPLCRAPEQEYRLRKNQVVGDLVDAFVAARGGVLELARRGVRGGEDGGEDEEGWGGRRRKRRCVLRAEQQEEEEVGVGVKEEEEEEVVEVPSPDDGLVPCPSCNRRLKLESVNTHLDVCLTTPSTLTSSSSSTPAPTTAARRPAPLPKITYSLMKEKDLRTKLTALGIPSTGGRKALQERHSEWVTIWNANIDAKRPRSKGELLADLAAWERANARPSNQIVKGRWSDERWGEEHRPHYRRLVEEARMRRGQAAPVKAEVDGEGEGENGGESSGSGGNGENGGGGVLTMVAVGRGEVPEVFGNGVGDRDVMGPDAQINGKRKYQEIDSTASSSSSSHTPNAPAVTDAVQ